MPSLAAIQILLIDDNPHMRTIATAVLKSAGIRKVIEASDGGQGLQMLRDHAIDLAIVDYNMFPLDGVEFTRLVRNSPDSANPYLPIIMMTGHSGKQRVYEARDAGVTEFLRKPFAANHLQTRLTSIEANPRGFIEAAEYKGPDRRRKTVDVGGNERREGVKESKAG